jgi:hypothetical protein
LDHFLIGVQWHPEVFEMADPHTRHLFRASSLPQVGDVEAEFHGEIQHGRISLLA